MLFPGAVQLNPLGAASEDGEIGGARCPGGTGAARMRRLVLIGAAAGVISALILGRYLAESASIERVPENVGTYVPEFRGTHGAFDVLAARGDGQGFAILYWDPALKHVGQAGKEESSYRAARPLLSYVAWILMGGRHDAAAKGIFLVAWLSSITAAVAVAALARSRGLSAWWGLIAVLLPGGIAAIPVGGADLLALTFSAIGLLLWPRRRLYAVIAMILAALSRETALVVPAGIALHGIVVNRRLHLGTAIPFAAWMSWASVVHWRYGAWPWEASIDQRLGLGVSTIVREPTSLLNVILLLFLVYVGLRRARVDVLPWVALCSAAFLFVLGRDVFTSWGNFARVLLPGYVAGILVCAEAWRLRKISPPVDQLVGPRS